MTRTQQFVLTAAAAVPALMIATAACTSTTINNYELGADAEPGAPDATSADDSSIASDGASDSALPMPPGCDPTADISPQAACVTDAFGVFVGGSGASDSSGNGTKKAPFASIGKAIAAATASQANVFVCAGTYAEHVTISTNVSLYGGFGCSDWTYATTNKTVVAPSDPGYVLQMSNVAGSVIEDLELDAKDGANPGDSSIAVFVSSSTSVTFRRAKIAAGDAGATPEKAATRINYSPSIPTAGAGLTPTGSANPQDGVHVQMCQLCSDDTASGGGASGTATGTGGTPGTAGAPTVDGGNNDGLGGTYNAARTQCGVGDNGSNALSSSGGTGSVRFGSVDSSGWEGGSGSPGAPGGIGQGGGGGSGGLATTSGAGGGGGCGGCGGGGGAAGAAGGSSFSVLSYKSTLTFDNCAVSDAKPTNGGPGGDGQLGQAGGNGGIQSPPGCAGGNGGNGGNGGGGGGGAAGVSVGIGYVGAAPTLVATVPTVSSTVAVGGAGGAHGVPAASKGLDGTNAATLLLASP